MLLDEEVDLDPAGWRAGLALGFELKDAGFAIHESRQILLQTKANSNIVDRMLEYVYQMKAKTSLTCNQIRKLNVICDQCPGQYSIVRSENRTEIC
jgi:metal-dependent HD superfamily phosphatase/phosphodiesterase